MVNDTIEFGGAVVFWSLSGYSSREKLVSGLADLGLSATVPTPQPPACLKNALEQVLGGPRVLVRPLSKRDGFTVVMEDRGEDSNDYRQTLTARILATNGNGTADGALPVLDFQPEDERSGEVRALFARQLSLLSAAQVGGVLVDLVEELGGIRLRPSGGIYWLPGNKLDEWQRIAQMVEGAVVEGMTRVYILRHKLDADAVRAVQDAVIAEVGHEAQRIEKEILAPDCDLGDRALQTRRDQAEALRQKVNLYEDILSVGLEGLHTALDRAEQAAAGMMLLQSAAAGAGSFANLFGGLEGGLGNGQ